MSAFALTRKSDLLIAAGIAAVMLAVSGTAALLMTPRPVVWTLEIDMVERDGSVQTYTLATGETEADCDLLASRLGQWDRVEAAYCIPEYEAESN